MLIVRKHPDLIVRPAAERQLSPFAGVSRRPKAHRSAAQGTITTGYPYQGASHRLRVGDSPASAGDNRHCGQGSETAEGWRRQRPRTKGYRVYAAPSGMRIEGNLVGSRLARFCSPSGICL